MANLNENDFIRCNPLQYKKGNTGQIDEIISLELPFHYDYDCVHSEQVYSGSKEIYAYPHNIEELIIGHTVLDLLPCYNSDFQYELQQDGEKFSLNLQATDKCDQEHVKILSNAAVDLEQFIQIMSKVLNAKGKWDGTGCFHRAALYHPLSEEIIIAEDIGRHNCVDRLKGHTIINNLPIEDYFLFITARITSSLYHKIRRAGIHTIVSRSAITSTAYLSAQSEHCTLAAFCRPEDERVTLFTTF